MNRRVLAGTGALRRVCAVALAVLVTLSVSCTGGVGRTGGLLRAEVLSCRATEGGPLALIQLGPTPGAPHRLRSLLPRAVLYGFEYRLGGSGPVAVGGYPPGPGAIDLMPPPASGARTVGGPPPRALVPVLEDEGPILSNVLMGVPMPVDIAAQGVGGLIGASGSTPLGVVRIVDAKVRQGALHVRLRYSWAEALVMDRALSPKGALLARVWLGDVQAPGDVSFVSADGRTQDLAFPLPHASDGAVRLTLDGWAVLVAGPIEANGAVGCGAA